MADGPTVFPTLQYRDARAAIAQLREAFGFTEEAVHEGADGSVAHAELSHGNGLVMLGTADPRGTFGSAMAGAGPTCVYVAVTSGASGIDAHCERARAAGVEILMEPTDQDYGSREYLARDLEGNVWAFGTYRPTPGG
nr:VOC family protein [Streptomyces sp. HNM0574]